jgi:hypothetical protein
MFVGEISPSHSLTLPSGLLTVKACLHHLLTSLGASSIHDAPLQERPRDRLDTIVRVISPVWRTKGATLRSGLGFVNWIASTHLPLILTTPRRRPQSGHHLSPPFSFAPSAAATEPAALLPGGFATAASSTLTDCEIVTHESAATPDKDLSTAGELRVLLLVTAGERLADCRYLGLLLSKCDNTRRELAIQPKTAIRRRGQYQ